MALEDHTRDGSADSRLRPAISNRSEPELEGMTEGHTFDFRSAGSRPIRSADGRASPVVSRPPTAGSGHYGYSQRSEVSSSSSSAQMAGVKSPPIYLNGPAYAQESSSSSKFPSESHRPPPKPPHAPIHSFSRPLLSSSATAPLPKQSKTKLNLLNPMSLLLRRRSGQTLEQSIR